MLLKIKNKFFLAFVSGALSAFAFAPFNFFLALLVSFSCFYFLLEKVKDSSKKTFWLGFSYGFGCFLAGIYWISISLLVDAAKFAWLIPFALTLIPGALAVYVAVFAVLYKKTCDKFKIELEYQKIIVFAIIFTLFEILRSYLFTGFPWNLSGYSMMFSDYSSQSANIFGVYGLSFFAVLFALSPVLYIKKSRLNQAFLLFLITLFTINFSYGYLRINSNNLQIKEDKIRIIQGDIKQSMKWDPYLKYQNLLKHINISKVGDKSNIKAIIWPETAVPYAIGIDKSLSARLSNVVDKNSFLITGGLYLDLGKNVYDIKNAYNSIFAIDEKAQMKRYDKHHLVPFGEYVPLQKFLPFVEKITGGGVGFSSGKGAKTLEMKGLKFAPLVCYEAIFPDKIIDYKNRPDLLVNLTNDSWFGRSSGPYQHLNMTRMRAIEYGISLARAANSGVSAYVDPFGRIIKKIDLNQSGFFDVNLIENLDTTIFSHFKYFVILLILLVFSLFLAIDLKLKNKHRKK